MIKRSSLRGDPAGAVLHLGRQLCHSAPAKEATVALHCKGDFFGGQPLRLATTATMAYSVITCLDKAASTVGRDEAAIREHTKKHEEEDKRRTNSTYGADRRL